MDTEWRLARGATGQVTLTGLPPTGPDVRVIWFMAGPGRSVSGSVEKCHKNFLTAKLTY